jgi:hypothetical protein
MAKIAKRRCSISDWKESLTYLIKISAANSGPEFGAFGVAGLEAPVGVRPDDGPGEPRSANCPNFRRRFNEITQEA